MIARLRLLLAKGFLLATAVTVTAFSVFLCYQAWSQHREAFLIFTGSISFVCMFCWSMAEWEKSRLPADGSEVCA